MSSSNESSSIVRLLLCGLFLFEACVDGDHSERVIPTGDKTGDRTGGGMGDKVVDNGGSRLGSRLGEDESFCSSLCILLFLGRPCWPVLTGNLRLNASCSC